MGMFWKIVLWCIVIQYFLPVPVTAYLSWFSGSAIEKNLPHFVGSSCKSDEPTCKPSPRALHTDDVIPSPPPSWFSLDFVLGHLTIYPLLAILSVSVLALVALWAYTLNVLCLIPIRLARKYLTRQNIVDTATHGIVDKLRKQLKDMEKERDSLKGHLAQVQRANSAFSLSPEENGPGSPRSDGHSRVSESTIANAKRDTKADYVRKCRYLARKLKDSETRMQAMREQVELAAEIKAEFDALVEHRAALGRQAVALTREKREAKQRAATLQAEVRAAKKQVELSGEQNVLLVKQAEVMNLNLKIAVRDKKTARKQLKELAEEAEATLLELNRVREENRALAEKMQGNDKLVDADSERVSRTSKIPIFKYVTKKNITNGTSGIKEGEQLGKTVTEETIEATRKKATVGPKHSRDSSKYIESKNIEQSLLNLERSVEKNLKLRKYAKSLISGSSSSDHVDAEEGDQSEDKLQGDNDNVALSPSDPTDIVSETARRQITASDLPADATTTQDGAALMPPSTASSNASYQGSAVDADANSDSVCSSCDGAASSICCFDACCSVCSVPGCTLSHVSCNDSLCLATRSSCSLQSDEGDTAAVTGEGSVGVDRQESRASLLRMQQHQQQQDGYVRQAPARRESTVIERLADIFGNRPTDDSGGWDIPGVEEALTTTLRTAGNVAINAGTHLVTSSRGEDGDGFSNASGSNGSLTFFSSSPSSSSSSSSSISSGVEKRCVTAAETSDKKQLSCFTRIDEAVARGKNANNTAAFRMFVEQMARGAQDPGLGDEEPITDEEGTAHGHGVPDMDEEEWGLGDVSLSS